MNILFKIFTKIYTKEIIFSKNLKYNNESIKTNLNIDIGLLQEDDISYFSLVDIEEINIIDMLRNADLCFIARYRGKPIHHTCVALKSFFHPRIHEKIRVNNNEAYIYGVYTNEFYRGYTVTPSVFRYIHQELRSRNIKKIFSHAWEGNLGSRKTFLKSGYIPYGKLSLIHFGKKYFWIVKGNRPYFNEQCIFRLSLFRFYRATLPELHRINYEINPFIQEWQRLDHKVALFGAGGHSHMLFNIISFPPGLICFVIDNNPMKEGRKFEPLKLTIQAPKVLQELKSDIIIVSSRAYQGEMVNQLVRELRTSSQVIKLYPHVAYTERR